MRILVVEDEQTISKALKKGLEQEAFSVDVANDGLTGYDLASTENYNLILLDLMLPKMSGEEICTTLRKENITTPILMLTAKSQVYDKVVGLNIGADDYLTKPFAFEELLARIRALLRRPQPLTEEILTCQDLELNSTSLKVSRAQKPIELSKKEFALLEHLLKHKNKTVTKEQLMENVWSFESDILPNTVEQYITYLRNKIEKPFPKKLKLIHTIRGFGYSIKE
jgi:DNA-binding response OmpR family regulator